MKLFVVAALVSVAAAARLEHLENRYLPPDHTHGEPGFNSQGFASGSSGSSGFDSNGIDSANAGSNQYRSAFPGATLNQYLPPDHGPSGSNGHFSGSINGFQRSQYTPQSSGASQYNQNRYGSASNGFGQSAYQQYSNNAGQFPSASNQYLAPKTSSPQQPFDEKTGYIY